MDEGAVDLGPCCACEKTGPDVRNVVCLNKRAPLPGRGWSCVICGLPADGAVYVVCDACLESHAPVRFACRGYPASDGRVPIEQLVDEFGHDPKRHEFALYRRSRCR